MFEKSGDGWEIRSVASSSLYLGLKPNSRSSGSELWGVGRHDRIVWLAESVVGGTFRIAPADTLSMNLDLSGGTARTKIVLCQQDGSTGRQCWELEATGKAANNSLVQTPVDNGVYTIHSVRTGDSMDINLRSHKVNGHPAISTDDQKWIFEQAGDGNWAIKNKIDADVSRLPLQ